MRGLEHQSSSTENAEFMTSNRSPLRVTLDIASVGLDVSLDPPQGRLLILRQIRLGDVDEHFFFLLCVAWLKWTRCVRKEEKKVAGHIFFFSFLTNYLMEFNNLFSLESN